MPSRIAAFLLLLGALVSPAVAKEKYLRAQPVHLDHDGEKWAEKTLRKLSLEEKVGQIFMVRLQAAFLNVESPAYLQLRDTIRKYHIGSILMTVPAQGQFVYHTEPYEAAALLNRLQSDSKLPLLVAADFERGLSMRLNGATVFPHAMAFGATGNLQYAEAFGRITAQEARAIGVHWNFFPIADVNSNPANPIINIRSFGGDSKQVGDMAAAYIRGARANGMLTTAKHFPGHGDTATDSHLGLAQVTADLPRLDSIELPPFREAISAGVDSIMVAHVTVPKLDPDPNHVATTSPAVVTDLLKNQLGFKGLVVTDAMDMGALTRLYQSDPGRAAVDAFKAGNDLITLPADLDAAYRAVLAAVQAHEIPPQQLDASVLKILKAKASVGLHKARLVDLNALPEDIGKPQNLAMGQQISDDAITLLRDNRKLLPLHPSGTGRTSLPYQNIEVVSNRLAVVILSDDVRTDSGRVLERQIRSQVPDASVTYVDPGLAGALSGEVLRAVDQARAVIAAVYEIPTAGKAVRKADGTVVNSVSLSSASAALLERILEHANAKTAVLAMGNPYLAEDFPQVQNYLCAYSNTTVSEASAVKALFGQIPIRGHLPVSIPRIAARGAGITRAAKIAEGGPSYAHSQITHH